MEVDREPNSRAVWDELLGLGGGAGTADQERAAALVQMLNRRGEADVVAWALPTLTDPDPWCRRAAAWVLGQHGYPAGRPYGGVVLRALARAARAEADDETRSWLVVAIGHADDLFWASELLLYADDSYAPVRQAVAGALPIIFRGEAMSEQAITALIDLSADPDPHVRDWATMSLGSQSDQDSDSIRAALRLRLDDGDDDDTAASGEALLGLAIRRDPAVYPYLERLLAAPPEHVGNLTVEAAGALGDPRFLPALHHLRDNGWQRHDPLPATLDHAISVLEQT